ncbi:MAG: cupin domain-containing protein [Planctomycetota bacterium]
MEVQVIRPSAEMLDRKKVSDWPIWTKEVSKFDWFYDSEEHCYLLEGHVFVSWGDERVEIREGDYVIFPKGLKCVWDIRKPVRKHYMFF